MWSPVRRHSFQKGLGVVEGPRAAGFSWIFYQNLKPPGHFLRQVYISGNPQKYNASGAEVARFSMSLSIVHAKTGPSPGHRAAQASFCLCV